ncbi:helix-turn-helix domain-containing protein [Bradyrhizobium sp. AZCC 2230]|uniref:helix-turn-helix domain-containing protein n=1 Tax=Bradyrhizobium sp. AZCC 2230 TaxID=3117021 RepID=UPI002FF10672
MSTIPQIDSRAPNSFSMKVALVARFAQHGPTVVNLRTCERSEWLLVAIDQARIKIEVLSGYLSLFGHNLDMVVSVHENAYLTDAEQVRIQVLSEAGADVIVSLFPGGTFSISEIARVSTIMRETG